MRSFNVPLLLLGGGGYTIRNVARCWCYETGVALGIELEDKMPEHQYYEYFGPEYNLHVAPSNMENKNSLSNQRFLRIFPSFNTRRVSSSRSDHLILNLERKTMKVKMKGQILTPTWM